MGSAPAENVRRGKHSGRKTQIVVVGGGAGGLALVRKLGAKFGRKQHDIILVDQNLSHIWKPLLHEVAAGSLDANLDEVGYRGHCYKWGYRFFQGSLSGIDRGERTISLAPVHDDKGNEVIAGHTIRYDYLVLAVGSISNDFGVPGVKEHCIYLDSRDQADIFRTKLLNNCLRVSRAMMANPDANEQVKIAIVGAGATGVELAAELYNAAGALRHYGLEVFDESRLKVTLLEAGPRILPALPEKLAGAARHELNELGVIVQTDTQVIKARPRTLFTSAGEELDADLIVWAAGVKGAEFLGSLGLETNRRNQIIVHGTMQTLDDDRIFALGDCASYTPEGEDMPIPPRAQAAHQMAGTVFKNIVRSIKGKPLKTFVYEDKGSLISLSRFSTVGSLMGNLVGGSLAVEGRMARFIYTSLYRLHLLGIHGWMKGLFLMAIGRVNRIVRPRLKLH
ncbi:NAD(P)/FAD-dependent oxidoreductase [Erythrobacter crassostreae]|uniref:NAD(P)/FAD-dependent oxidoreductase n=1 Tax=Erythrobacter crassostreae TaxID=2828328 RepID=A0A9X1JND7_9SPHN|nr:NAD(P)/FAD-dependent oxidoreductase [Erythrobacter crassostrea]MBV7259613.1 NAD(P)/FAD-dependent oxidoreductase [Erythrobacter crassostrea]